MNTKLYYILIKVISCIKYSKDCLSDPLFISMFCLERPYFIPPNAYYTQIGLPVTTPCEMRLATLIFFSQNVNFDMSV